MDIEELRQKKALYKKNTDAIFENMQTIIDDNIRTAKVAHNTKVILDEYEEEFNRQTGLNGVDTSFLFLATALQVARITIINKLTQTEKAGTGNEKEGVLHGVQEKILHKFDDDKIMKEKPYYASLHHIVTRHGVPYDATAYLTNNLHLFEGANHRFSTLGHDPVLGLLFGTANIMTNTITCVKQGANIGGIGIPLISTNHVVYDMEYKHPKIKRNVKGDLTLPMLQKAIDRTKNDPKAFVAALIKQIIHIGTDIYTPCGIQIPAANLVLSNSNVECLTKYISMGDIIKVGTSAKIAELINILITTLHMLLYNSNEYVSKDIYSVKTKKIIMYSNLIATTSNIIGVAANAVAGDKTSIKNLDIGGIIVTINRLLTDINFIYEIKKEFVFGNFNKLIQGEKLKLKEIEQWD